MTVPRAAECRRTPTCSPSPGWSASKGAARRAIGEGGAYVNNVRLDDPEAGPAAADLLAGGWLLLRRGKRNLAGVKVA